MHGWECLYKHADLKLFLSVYVDDLLLAGEVSSVKKCWADLSNILSLEPPVSHHDSVYLGIRQRSVPVSQDLLENQGLIYKTLFADTNSQLSLIHI